MSVRSPNRINALGKVLLLALISFSGCERSLETRPAKMPQSGTNPQRHAQEMNLVSRVRPQVEAFCGDCHAMPRPTSSSRKEWVDEINQGFTLYGESGRSDLDVPAYDDVLKFFQYQAPKELDHWAGRLDYPVTTLPLETVSVRLPGNRPPGVTNVGWMDLGIEETNALVYCDISTGAINAHWPRVPGQPTRRIATVLQPVHTEPCDLDADGHVDLVVADIGEFNANDSDLGRVLWLRRNPIKESYEKVVLQDGLGRVSDVQPGDFDADGDTDLLVAIFGWRTNGRIVLLEHQGLTDGRPTFVLRDIDERHGPVQVLPQDLNDDGHLDFVALIGQEHERVEAFLNDGTGVFANHLIYRAPDPAYGSSGIELVDLDRDGDLDVLYTNGDSFDRGPKPHHSIQWLENEGSYPYKHHEICKMPGVLNAQAGDFDRDGDIDVVAVSLLAEPVNSQISQLNTSSVVLLSQTSPGNFEPSQIEGRQHQHLSVEVDDFDGNGATDFAIGNFRRSGSSDQPDLKLWMNRSPRR